MNLSQPNQLELADLYDQDFCLWSEQMAQILRNGNFAELDLAHLIEEVEDMGKSQQRALLSNLRVLLMHLLNYQYQPHKRTPSWRHTIIEHRIRLADALEESPSLKPYLADNIDKVYQKARKQATIETELPTATFPKDCPFELANILDDDWMP